MYSDWQRPIKTLRIWENTEEHSSTLSLQNKEKRCLWSTWYKLHLGLKARGAMAVQQGAISTHKAVQHNSQHTAGRELQVHWWRIHNTNACIMTHNSQGVEPVIHTSTLNMHFTPTAGAGLGMGLAWGVGSWWGSYCVCILSSHPEFVHIWTLWIYIQLQMRDLAGPVPCLSIAWFVCSTRWQWIQLGNSRHKDILRSLEFWCHFNTSAQLNKKW